MKVGTQPGGALSKGYHLKGIDRQLQAKASRDANIFPKSGERVLLGFDGVMLWA